MYVAESKSFWNLEQKFDTTAVQHRN